MNLFGGALATSTKSYLTALPNKNVFLFGLTSEGGGVVLFVMRLRSMNISYGRTKLARMQ